MIKTIVLVFFFNSLLALSSRILKLPQQVRMWKPQNIEFKNSLYKQLQDSKRFSRSLFLSANSLLAITLSYGHGELQV